MSASTKTHKLPASTTEEGTTLVIRAPKRGRLRIRVIGETPLIMHRWSEKAVKEMLDKQRGVKSLTKREAKDPQQDYEASMYRMPDGSGYAFPAVAFKSAMVSACREIDGLTMAQARQAWCGWSWWGDVRRIQGARQARFGGAGSGLVRWGSAWRGGARHSLAGQARRGAARCGKFWQGVARQARFRKRDTEEPPDASSSYQIKLRKKA